MEVLIYGFIHNQYGHNKLIEEGISPYGTKPLAWYDMSIPCITTFDCSTTLTVEYINTRIGD